MATINEILEHVREEWNTPEIYFIGLNGHPVHATPNKRIQELRIKTMRVIMEQRNKRYKESSYLIGVVGGIPFLAHQFEILPD